MEQLYSFKELVNMWIDNNEFDLHYAPELGMILFELEWGKDGRLMDGKYYPECKLSKLLKEEQYREIGRLEHSLNKFKFIKGKYVQCINCAMDYLAQEINWGKVANLISDFKNKPDTLVHSTIDGIVRSYIVKRKEEYPELYLEVML